MKTLKAVKQFFVKYRGILIGLVLVIVCIALMHKGRVDVQLPMWIRIDLYVYPFLFILFLIAAGFIILFASNQPNGILN